MNNYTVAIEALRVIYSIVTGRETVTPVSGADIFIAVSPFTRYGMKAYGEY